MLTLGILILVQMEFISFTEGTVGDGAGLTVGLT